MTDKVEQLINSLPVRKTISDGNKRDEFEWNQWQSATKAMNNNEVPAKEKHIRNLCFGTFQLEGARLFWSMINRIHVESHPITSWKFCWIFHRLLRDGHRYVLQDSLPFISYFEQLKKYWSGLQHNYGLLTYCYCQLILCKLKLHEENASIAGNLTLADHDDIRRLLNENFQTNLQLCLNLMDYLSMIITLVQTIFTSLDQSRTNSMTPAGQCRLSPLVVFIQDSHVLYDYIVKILFQLHEGLPGNALQEQRERAIELFRKLKWFYNQASKLQYLKTLIKVPVLAENPPNFEQQEDLKHHQRVSSSDRIVSDTEKDISILEQRLMQSDALLEQTRSETDDLHRTIAERDAELLTERQKRVELEEQLRQQMNQQDRWKEIQNSENSNEKFKTLMETYNHLNEEHQLALRQKNELTEQLNRLKDEYQKKSNELIELRQTNDELQARIQSLSNERNDYALLTQTTNERMKEIEQAKESVERRLKEFEEKNTKRENQENEESLIDLVYEREKLEEKIADREAVIREWAQKFVDLADKQKLIQTNHQNYIHHLKQEYKQSILTHSISQMHQVLDGSETNEPIHPKYLERELRRAMNCLRIIEELWKKDSDVGLPLLNEFTNLSHHFIDITRYKAQDPAYREALLDCIRLYSQYQTDTDRNELIDQTHNLFERLQGFLKKVND